MTRTIPRALVSEATGMPEAALPEGDLPLPRYAEHYGAFLAALAQEEAEGHPEQWTDAVMGQLIASDPALALAAIRAILAGARDEAEVAALAGGALEELVLADGAAVIDDLEAGADPAMRAALALLDIPPHERDPAVWPRIAALASAT
ncbi:DUF6869 domain-containing protein [Wenxinia saemankumensis]|uniref:DUF6869 domain-containing protein n=1 Tax=Wenxinia saemankumensis TaxID=1447782 RepID=A0A1M6CWC9_9RHOB|nr:hypothetical protein [Wenxinia saemankumensis]SHI65193.1 hypothetical protein SAMN05444417_1396 [Wenxinia saemankumensis]